jgi:hypothetical protein
MGQKEITSAVPALEEETGDPINFGWARFPFFAYNSLLINAPRRQVCESERYILFSSTHLIILEILDHGYLGYAGMSVVSLLDRKRSSQRWLVPFPLGSFDLPKNSDEGQVKLHGKKYMFNFAAMDDGVRIIKIDIPHFGHHKSLRGELVLTPPPGAQSMTTNMPWRRKKHAFRCCQRSPWYIAEGVILFGAQELFFNRGSSWGIYEWNRGVRPRADVRFWASGCGKSDSRQVGISVGYDSADSAMGTENAFFLDGVIHKLDQVTFQVSPSNWLLPWRFTSNDNRLEMIFTPHQERMEILRTLFYSLKRRQVCGFFSGKVILDDGSEFVFENITGFAERRKTR